MLLTLPAWLAAASSAPSRIHRNASLSFPNYVVTQFPVGTWIENIAVRPNGNLLLTSLTPNASLYEVSNPASLSPTVTLHFTIDTVSSLMGITELSADQFAVVGGNFSGTSGGMKGSFGLWSVDFASGQAPKPKLHASIPDAVLLNGATTVPQSKDIVLVADSVLGLVWRVDTTIGNYDIAVQIPEMGSVAGNSTTIGINGLHIHDGYLWWTNDFQTTLYRVRITEAGLPVGGAQVEKIAKPPALALDDFTFGPGNTDIAWVATNSDNRVFAVKPGGESVVIAGAADSFTVAKATACKFGRTKRDVNILYVTTGGETINGTTQGGKVEAIDVGGF